MIPDLGWFGLPIGIIVNIPQLQKILKTKEAKHISLRTYLLLAIVQACYLTHSININDLIYILSNIAGLSTSVAILFFGHKYGARLL